MQYISVRLYKKMLTEAKAEGANLPDELLQPVAEAQNEQAVPAEVFFELHEQLDQLLPSGFSVRVGQQMKIEDYGVLGLSWRTCSRAGEIFERCERYFHLLSNSYVFKVIENGALSKIYLYRDAYRRGVALSNEATFSATTVVLKAMTEKVIMPIEVAFKHGPPTDMTSYTEAFNCPILFNQPHNYISYKTTDLQTPTAKADHSINTFLLERVQEEKDGMEISVGKVIADVEGLIRNALPSGIPSTQEVSKHMSMSSRTLTRRLSERGHTFRGIVQRVQENTAKELLHNSSHNISEIAFQTGFSEVSAFSRAFKRWTGHSPLEHKKL